MRSGEHIPGSCRLCGTGVAGSAVQDITTCSDRPGSLRVPAIHRRADARCSPCLTGGWEPLLRGGGRTGTLRWLSQGTLAWGRIRIGTDHVQSVPLRRLVSEQAKPERMAVIAADSNLIGRQGSGLRREAESSDRSSTALRMQIPGQGALTAQMLLVMSRTKTNTRSMHGSRPMPGPARSPWPKVDEPRILSALSRHEPAAGQGQQASQRMPIKADSRLPSTSFGLA